MLQSNSANEDTNGAIESVSVTGVFHIKWVMLRAKLRLCLITKHLGEIFSL